MDDERSGRAMTDTAIDREIQAALTVDPSPQFVARVRARIASEPARAASWLSWKLVASGAMAALIVIAFVLMRPGEQTFNARPEPVEGRARGTLQSRPRSATTTAATTQPRRAETPKARTLTRRAGAPQARRRPEPELLLDPAETRALRRLIAGTRDGSLDLSPALRATTPTAMDLAPIDAIVIAPLTIDPLTPSGEEGVRP